MALARATLKTAILDLLGHISTDPDPATRRAAQAAAWATAFDTYASSVTNINLDPPVTPGNKAGFQAALGLAGTTSAALAQEFGAAWAAYWAGMTFVPGPAGAINAASCPNLGGDLLFGVITTSTITVVNSASLIAALTAHFTSYRGSSRDAAADQLAGIFHDNTTAVASLTVLTVGVDTTPPIAGPLPITNTCRVF